MLREQGNKLFREASASGLAPVLRKSRYEEAIKFYRQALGVLKADQVDDMLSCTKNLGVSFCRLAELQSKSWGLRGSSERSYFQWAAKQCFDYMFQTLSNKYVSALKGSLWITGIKANYVSPLVKLLHESLDRDVDDKLQRLQSFDDIAKAFESHSNFLIESKSTAAHQFYLTYAQLNFHVALDILDKADDGSGSAHRISLSKVQDCGRWLELARQVSENSCERGELDEIKEQVFFHQCKCESVMARTLALKELDRSLKDNEELDMDSIHHVIDQLKEATVLAREIDLENEAVATAALGRVYGKVLKMNEKAYEYNLKAIQLAQSLVPQDFTSQAWYQECLASVEGERNRREETEQKEYEQARKPYYDAIKDQINELKVLANSKGTAALLKFVYEKYPTTPPSELGPIDAANIKKTLQRAIVAYHPDKKDKSDMAAYVLHDEITKVLTWRYNMIKETD